MKRNQKRERTHLVDQGFEEFMTYFRSTFGGFKELCQSVECPIGIDYTNTICFHYSACDLTLSEQWGIYKDGVSKFMDTLDDEIEFTENISAHILVLSHPFFKDIDTGKPVSWENALDLILSKWEIGYLDYKTAAVICEAIITDKYKYSLNHSKNKASNDIKPLYDILKLKVAGASIRKVSNAACIKNNVFREFQGVEMNGLNLAFLFYSTFRMAVSYSIKSSKLLPIGFQRNRFYDKTEKDYLMILTDCLATYHQSTNL